MSFAAARPQRRIALAASDEIPMRETPATAEFCIRIFEEER
jgi:hypothetical protein